MDVGPWTRNPEWKRRMSKAYLALHQEISEALYEEDPEGFGASIESPRDEYDGEAAGLIASLRQLNGDVQAALAQNFSHVPDPLIGRVERAWREYERHPARATPS